jgi:DnaK suppressor protein
MKAKKISAKRVIKTAPAKATGKPAKKMLKAKPVAKKLAAKAKPPRAPVAKKPVAPKKKLVTVSKPAAKALTGFSIKAAAAKLKNALTKPAKQPHSTKVVKKPAPPVGKKPMHKALPIVVSQRAAKVVVPAPKSKSVTPSKSTYVSPKGVLSEGQIRRMSDKDYMADGQLEFFRHRLLQMRNEVLERELDVKERLHQREVFADPADRATAEEEHWLDLRLRERESLLLHKIDDALRRIADREYGYCEKTGDAIGIPRLLARPTATVCVDVKGQDERIESQFRDR